MRAPAALFLALLAAQFGVQPVLNQAFLGAVSKPALIVATEALKLVLGTVLLWVSTTAEQRAALSREWTPAKALARSLPPGVLYSLQNYLILYGSAHLSPLTLSLLNQTKTLSTALFAFLLLGKRQTIQQILALLGLMFGATLIVAPWQANSHSSDSWSYGVAAVALASLLSGLSSSLCEKALQASTLAGTSLVFSMELAVFSLISLSSQISTNWEDLKKGWTMYTWLPVLSSAVGGILVGIVTQKTGGVAKGIALIFGIVLTFILEAVFLNQRAAMWTDVAAVVIVCLSLYLHNTGGAAARSPAPRGRIKAE